MFIHTPLSVVSTTTTAQLVNSNDTVFITGADTGGTYTLPITTVLTNGFKMTIVKLGLLNIATIEPATGQTLYTTGYLADNII